MRTIMKRTGAVLLYLVLVVSLAGCKETDTTPTNPIFLSGTGSSTDGTTDFQKNMHQSEELSFVETDSGWYFSENLLYFIDKETMRATVVCGKPDCKHNDETCNAWTGAMYLLTGGDRVYYVSKSKGIKLVESVKPDATDRMTAQELKFHETSFSQSSYDHAIYHRGYVYYVSDDILYRVTLGGEKESSEVVWNPEKIQATEMLNGYQHLTGNEIRYTLWAEGDFLYFMTNLQDANRSYKDMLFACDLSNMRVKQVWVTPGKTEVGEWEETGVSVSQWYVTGGYIYFYLSGGDMWRSDLASGKMEKLADTHKQAQYGSAVFSDEYMCLLNDIPVGSYNDPTPQPGSIFRSFGDTIYIYGLDGTLVKDIPLDVLYDAQKDTAKIDMICCAGDKLFFLATSMIFTHSDNGEWGGQNDAVILYCANIKTGEVTQVYSLR